MTRISQVVFEAQLRPYRGRWGCPKRCLWDSPKSLFWVGNDYRTIIGRKIGCRVGCTTQMVAVTVSDSLPWASR